ncbi:MAG: aldo/keto reductase [Candidatus Brocadiia bacterium]
MEYRTLGSSGVKVSQLGLGTMNFGGRTSEEDAHEIIHTALDAGLNLIDTADVYNKGASEEIVGRAIKDVRDDIVLATKFWAGMGEGPNDRGGSRYHIVRACEDSLRRLDTDRIDLYQIHRPDKYTPIEETLRALDDLVNQGKVLYIGTSSFPAWRHAEARLIAEFKGLAGFTSEQPPYNILDRYIDKFILPYCQEHGIGVIPWSPLSAGWLTGKYRKGQEPPEGTRGAQKHWMVNLETDIGQQKLEQVEQLIPLAEECGTSLVRFSLAWLMQRPGVTAPLIGPRTLEQAEDCLQALDVTLEQDVLEKVDEIVPPGTPGMAEGQYWPEPG